MNTMAAIAETMKLADGIDKRQVKNLAMYLHSSLGYKHLCEMRETIMRDGDMSETKLSRWLAWMQCSIVSWNAGADLDTMKTINRKHSDAMFVASESLRTDPDAAP